MKVWERGRQSSSKSSGGKLYGMIWLCEVGVATAIMQGKTLTQGSDKGLHVSAEVLD